MRLRSVFSTTLVVTLSLMVSSAVFGQVERGTVVGRVTDATGGVAVGAEVTVLNTGTNVAFQTTTDESGGYIAPTLVAGTYDVTVRLEGFRTETHRGILVEIGQRVRADFSLQVGQVTESVDVSAEGPLIQSESSTLGTVIAEKTITDLPLNGRSFISLLTLSSGITAGTPGRLLNGRGTQVVRGASAFSANGMRDTQNNFLVDGIDNNEMAVSTITYFPSIDAIQEFKVQTSASDAEFGRNGGGTVNLTVKSGTNQLHGTVFEFFRNEKLDAKNFFDPPNAPTPPLKRNQYGFSLGGPIVRQKTFFFGDYEGKNYSEAQTFVSTVPTKAQRVGDFSAIRPIYDPTTYDATSRLRERFANDRIPANRISAPSAVLKELYPDPNQASPINNFVFTPARVTDGDQFDVKIDQYFSEADSMFVRYSYAAFKQFQPGELPGIAGGDGFRFHGNNSSPVHQIALTHTHLFSPTLINTLRLGFTRLTIDHVALNFGKDISAQAGIPGVNYSDFSSGLLGIQPDGYRRLGDSNFTPGLLFQNNYHLQENIAWIHGTHSFKGGIDIRRRHLNFFQVGNPRGNMTFSNVFTTQPQTPAGTGDGFASFLLGIPSSASQDRLLSGPYGQRYWELGWFVKDDWRVKPNLTLNLGLRYEVFTPLEEMYDRMSNFDLASGQIIPVATQGWPRGGVESDYNNFAPRFGFAWSPGGARKLSVHGGFGLFYNIEASAGGKRLTENPPFLFLPSVTNDQLNPTRFITDGFPLTPQRPDQIDLATLTGVSLKAWDRDWKSGYALQYNFSIETEVARNLVVRTMYVGSRGVHLFATGDANQPTPGPGAVNPRRPYPRFSGIGYFAPRGNSTYHSFQLQAERRLARGLSFLSALTISKAIDDNSGAFNDNEIGGGARTEDNRNYRLDKSLSDFHVGKRFVNSFVWELPFGRNKKFGADWSGVANTVLGGWQINGVLTLQDGNPFSATGADRTNGAGGNRPDRIGEGNLPKSQRTLENWFDKTAFRLPELYNFGTAGRNIVFGPGLVNLDFSTFKNTALTERINLQFRVEFFNLTNTPNFGLTNTRIDLAAGGVINVARAPRILQLGLKLIF